MKKTLGNWWKGRLGWSGLALTLIIAGSALAQDAVQEVERIRALEMRHYRVWSQAMNGARTSGAGMDVTFYDLDLRVTAVRGYLEGRVTTAAIVVGSPITQVTTDLSASITVDSVHMDGLPVAYSHPGPVLVVTLPRSYAGGERISWTVFYRGFPASTGFGTYTDSLRSGGVRWIYTLSEPYGAREWWPCVDHPTDKADSVNVRITCPSGLTAVSNGRLMESTVNGDGTSAFHWQHRFPIASYLLSVNVGVFDTFTDWYRSGPADSMAVKNYVQPDLLTRNPAARAAAGKTPRMLEVFEGLFGPYPFRPEGYGHIEFGWGGGMEHQTLTSLGAGAFNESTISHELTHQWFGDLITCRSWSDLWLNEGFASYGDMLFREREYGRATFLQGMIARVASARSAVGTLRVEDTTSVGNMFAASRVYNKGAWVLHMLRHVLGDSSFFSALKAYAADPAFRFRTASTETLRDKLEAVTGRDLSFFFDQWVGGQGYPAYTYAMSVHQQAGRSLVTFRLRQSTGTSNPAFFRMPIDLRFVGSSLDTTITVWNDTTRQSWLFTFPARPDFVEFDPDSWILKTADLVPMSQLGDPSIPTSVQLSNNFPNPFNGTTWIRVGLPERSHVLLEVFDMAGRRVAGLVDEVMDEGTVDIPWTTVAPSGVYLCRIVATGGTETGNVARKLVLVR